MSITLELTAEQERRIMEQIFKRMSGGPEPTSLADYVTRLPGGTEFHARDVANRFGVNTQSVGRSLYGLSNKGLVERLGGGGWKRL